MEEFVITILIKNARERGPYKQIMSDYKYYKDEMPTSVHSAIALLADEENETQRNLNRHSKQQGGRGN